MGIWGPSSYWHAAAEQGKPPLPGIDVGTMAMAVRIHHPDGAQTPVFAVWVGEGGGGSTRFRDVPSRTPSGTRRDQDMEFTLAGVPVEFHTTNGVGGLVNIGRDSFALAQGDFFLVAKHDGKLDVKQLPLAKLNLPPVGTNSLGQITTDYLRTLAATDADISAFWTAAAGPKAPAASAPSKSPSK